VDLAFQSDGKTRFPTKHHGEVTLSKKKWELICCEPERFYYKFNADKISTTLINPDSIRYHKVIPDQVIYYKRFEKFYVSDKSEGPLPCKFWSVVIDTTTQRICTMYPTPKPKPGKEYQPEGRP